MTRRGATLTFTDDDYFNPWLASRWLAFWVDLMLQEANGDMDLVVRVYNWGIGAGRVMGRVKAT